MDKLGEKSREGEITLTPAAPISKKAISSPFIPSRCKLSALPALGPVLVSPLH